MHGAFTLFCRPLSNMVTGCQRTPFCFFETKKLIVCIFRYSRVYTPAALGQSLTALLFYRLRTLEGTDTDKSLQGASEPNLMQPTNDCSEKRPRSRLMHRRIESGNPRMAYYTSFFFQLWRTQNTPCTRNKKSPSKQCAYLTFEHTSLSMRFVWVLDRCLCTM